MRVRRLPAAASDDAADFVADRESSSSLGTGAHAPGRLARHSESLLPVGFERDGTVRRSTTVP